MLHINDLTYRIAGRLLFDKATVAIPAGHKVGLVGRNGSGKTTLFNLIGDELNLDDGHIRMSGRARIGRVAQDAPDGPESLLETVLAADTERSALLMEAETATAPDRIAHIHTRLADIDAHTAPARAGTILAGLGFDEDAQGRPCSDFSGGWRMRVSLAAALFARPDLMLLDEPTNHLDLEATIWLENHLANWRGTLLVISHDRDLLNKVADEIIHLEKGKLVRYAGNYDRFEKTRRERLVLQSKMQAKQQDERKRIEAFVERFRFKASKARQAQSRLKQLARMEPIASVIEDRTIPFTFPNPDLLPPPLIALEDASAGYAPGEPVLEGLDLRIDMDDRIALIGANGNGKSTLVKLLAGRLKPLTGNLRKSSKLKVGYFAQSQRDELDAGASAYDHMARLMPMATESKVRAHLGRFGFSKDKADTKTGSLSGGEKARLLFALTTLDAPHILLLDEPTNHLDVDAREALVQALNAYDGAVILVSHDVHLVGLVCDRLWLVADGACRPFDGDLADYRRLLLDRRRERRTPQNRTETGGAPGNGKGKKDRKQARKDRAAARAATADLRKAVREAEQRLEKLNLEMAAMERDLADPKVYEGSTTDLMERQLRHGDIKAKIAKTEETWLKTQEALEKAG